MSGGMDLLAISEDQMGDYFAALGLAAPYVPLVLFLCSHGVEGGSVVGMLGDDFGVDSRVTPLSLLDCL